MRAGKKKHSVAVRDNAQIPGHRARVLSPIAAAVDTRVPRRTGRLVLRGRGGGGGGAVPLHGPTLWLTEQANNPLAAVVTSSPGGVDPTGTDQGSFRVPGKA